MTLVIGSHGLLGASVVRALSRAGETFDRVSVPWDQPVEAVEALMTATSALLAAGRPWRVMWCAGAGVIGTTQDRLDAELQTISTYLDQFATLVSSTESPGAVFLASSAGGVYAGSADPPFSEATTPRPISPYGHAKLDSEQLFADFAERSGVPLFIGRIANIYGPGQDITKAQGLISQLCRAHLERRPVSIYVSLDTSRDYLYVDDAARLAVAGLERAARQLDGGVYTKILASQRGTTVASILGELRRITRLRPRVVLGSSPLAKFQTRDLRFRSDLWPDLDRLVTTSLPAGMFATLEDLGLATRVPKPAVTET